MSFITRQSITCGNHEIHPVYSNHAIVKKKMIPKKQNITINYTHHPMVLLQQRIEDVVIIWYRQVHQDMKYYSSHQPTSSQQQQQKQKQQFNHNENDNNVRMKEKYIILEYCRKILYHILLVGHIQTINRPCPNEAYYTTLCKQRFPSLQDLPCMVVIIQDWYFDLVLQKQQLQHQNRQNQNHSKMMLCLYQRFLSKEQQHYITVDKYINACENIVRKWIGLSHNETILTITTTPTTTIIVPIQNQQQQQQNQQQQYTSRNVDRVHSNSSSIAPYTRNQLNKYHRTSNGIINYPIDDKNIPSSCVSSQYLLTSLSSRSTPSLSDENIEDGDKKPAAKPNMTEDKHVTIDSNNLPTAAVCCSSTTTDGMNNSSKNPNDRINRLRGMILMMYHAVKCPFHDPTSSNSLYHQKCPVYEGCDAIKKLQKHIAKTISFDPDHETKIIGSNGMLHTCKCIYSVLCRDGKESIQHYIHCQSMKCIICGPVLRHLPNMKQEIQNAILSLQQQQQQQHDDDDLVTIVTEALISLSSLDKTPVITTTTTTKQHHNLVVQHNTTTTTMMNELATKNNNNNNNTKTMKRTKITKRKQSISYTVPKENALTTTTNKKVNEHAKNSQVNDRNNNVKSIQNQKKKQKTCHHTIMTKMNNISKNASNNNNNNNMNHNNNNNNTLVSFTTSPPSPTTKTTTLSSSVSMVQQHHQQQQQSILILPPIILPPPNYLSKSIK